MQVAVQLVGAFRVVVDGRAVPHTGWRRRPAELVKLLALTPGHRLHREAVVETLWPELTAQRGAANLHKAAHHVRKATRSERAVVLGDGLVQLWPDDDVHVDLNDIESEARQALDACARQRCAAVAER